MPRRKSTPRKRVSSIRYRGYKPKRMKKSAGKRMQTMATSYMKKKYTVIIPLRVGAAQDLVEGTISIFGAKNTTDPNNTVVLTNCDPDGMATADMALHQMFRITGLAAKIYFPEGTTPEATPVQWSLGYSANQVIKPSITFGPLQSLQTFQTSSCSAARPVKRYFRTYAQQKKLGIAWCNTDEYANFGANPPVALYDGQLEPNSGSSLHFKVYRSRDAIEDDGQQLARLQVTYYVTYRGTKGQTSLV